MASQPFSTSCAVNGCPNAYRNDVPVFFMMLNKCGHADWLQLNIKEPLAPTDVFTVCELHTFQNYKRTLEKAKQKEKCPPAVPSGPQFVTTKTSTEEEKNKTMKEKQADPNTYIVPGPSTSGVKKNTKNVFERPKIQVKQGQKSKMKKLPKTDIQTAGKISNEQIIEKGQRTKRKELPKTDVPLDKIRKIAYEIKEAFQSSNEFMESDSSGQEEYVIEHHNPEQEGYGIESTSSEHERIDFSIQSFKIELSADDNVGIFNEDFTSTKEGIEHNVNEDEVLAPEIDVTAINPLFIGLEDVKQESDFETHLDIEETVIQRPVNNTILSDILIGIFDQYVTENTISKKDVEFLLSLPFDKKIILSNSSYYNDIKEFAKYLYLCSPTVYKSIAENYISCLPSEENILQEWISKCGDKGFSKEALDAIKTKVSMSSSDSFCALHINQIYNSMIFIISAVAVNASWKVPICYIYSHNPLDGIKRAKILQFAANLLEQSGVIPISVTYQPDYQNMIMADYFIPNIKHYCEKMIITNKGRKVYLIPDPVFMLDNFKWSVMKDNDNKVISMKHVELLVQHLNFLQAGELSSRLIGKSVAHSLLLCQKDMKDSGYADVSGTAEFLLKLNQLLDILISHRDGKDLQQAPSITNIKRIYEILMQLLEYFSCIAVPCKTDVFTRNLNYGHNLDMSSMLLNLMTAVCSASSLLYDVVGKSLPFLEMSKLSLASTMVVTANFSKVIHYGLLTKLPLHQFLSRYLKNFKYYSVISSSNKNSLPIENVSLLPVLLLTSIQKINVTTYQKNSNGINPMETKIRDDLYKILKFDNSEFEEQSLIYIAGYVVYKLVRTLRCDVCINALLRPNPNRHFDDDYVTELVIKKPIFKLTGKLCLRLMEPSYEVIKICKLAEIVFRRSVLKNRIFSAKKFMMVEFPESMIGKDFFRDLDFHRSDGDVLYNHVVELPKAIVEVYLNVRLKYKCRRTRCYLTNTIWGSSIIE